MASILVIDDQALQREICRDLLQGDGHEVTAVATGGEARILLKSHTFDLILVDIFLERENGVDLCAEFARHFPDVPTIIMTATPSLENAINTVRSGAYDFMVKPLEPELVRFSLRRALERKALLDEKGALVHQLMESNHALRSFRKITLAALTAARPLTILRKALHGTMDVARASGGVFLLRSKVLKIPFPYPERPSGEDGGPTAEDFERILADLSRGVSRLLYQPIDDQPHDLVFRGPVMAVALPVEPDTPGAFVIWRRSGAEPFRAADFSLVGGPLRPLLSLLKAHVRQRTIQADNTRLSRRVAHSSLQLRKIRQKLERVIEEVRLEKTRSSEAIQRLETINRIGHELGSFVDIDHHIARVMGLCLDAVGARIVSLMLYDKESGQLYIKKAVGLPIDVVSRTKVNPGEGIAGWVYAHNEPLFVSDVELDSRFMRKSIEQYETRSLISAPVRVKNRAIGVLNVNNKTDGTPFTPEDLNLLIFISSEVGVALENSALYEDVQNTYFETIRVLIRVLEAKDEVTKGHSERVTHYCLVLARAMGFSPQKQEVLKRAGILHDLGKVAMDLSILNKEGKLSDDEYLVMKQHPSLAAEIIAPMRYMEEVQTCIQQHHERADGRGYPHGIREIVPEARILSVADSWDAMISWRPYRQPLSIEEAVDELRRCSGSQFDPEVVETLVDLLRRGLMSPPDEGATA